MKTCLRTTLYLLPVMLVAFAIGCSQKAQSDDEANLAPNYKKIVEEPLAEVAAEEANADKAPRKASTVEQSHVEQANFAEPIDTPPAVLDVAIDGPVFPQLPPSDVPNRKPIEQPSATGGVMIGHGQGFRVDGAGGARVQFGGGEGFRVNGARGGGVQFGGGRGVVIGPVGTE